MIFKKAIDSLGEIELGDFIQVIWKNGSVATYLVAYTDHKYMVINMNGHGSLIKSESLEELREIFESKKWQTIQMQKVTVIRKDGWIAEFERKTEV